MQKYKEYDLKIAAYFDNEMSEEEEGLFMREVGDNPALREKFEEELSLHAILGSAAPITGKETLDAAGDLPLTAGGDKFTTKNRGPVIFFYRRTAGIAAILLLVISAAVVFMLIKNNRDKNRAVARVPATIDTITKINDSSIHSGQLLTSSQTAAIAFAKLYKPYTSDNDPVEASEFYQDYMQGRYASVLKATNADVQVMGVEDDKNRPVQYLQLYKGLAYLAQDEPAKALTQFGDVLHTAAKQDAHYYTAQWYSCMALLKLGDVQKADSTAKLIAQSKSPYAANAKAFPSAIKGK